MGLSDKQFACWFLRLGVGLLTLMLALQLWLDPFWAWRQDPPWLRWHEGHNWNLDIRMRAAKPLQVAMQDADTVLIGSSRTYHGFDPTSLSSRTYNYGISGLRIREMEGFVSHLLRYQRPRTVVIGLDYFMFDARYPTVRGYNPGMAKPLYLADAIPAALFSADAIGGARLAITGKGPREGVWHAGGYKPLFPLAAEKMPEILEAQRDNLGRVVLDEEGYEVLERVLAKLGQAGVGVKLYLSPVHPSQYGLLREDDALPRFDTWKARLQRLAEAEGIRLYDFTEARFGDEAALFERGTTAHWQDPTHFTPLTGAWLLAQMEVE